MFKVLQPNKDAYLTNRIIDGTARTTANTGRAGSLDIFKLFGYTSTLSGTTQLPNTELSRLLVQFDLSPLRALVSQGAVDPGNPSFSCRLHLSDVYGGQPTPDNFTVVVNPLSASFDEGHGRDVVLYSDNDVCNWLTSSLASGSWFITGCGLAGNNGVPCDYLTASSVVKNGASLQSSQFFAAGTEDLDADVTLVVSATLAGLLPDAGFRVALDPSLENDQHTYFVKRFASRTAFNAELRPKLLVRFDNSIQDDTNNLFMDATSYLFMYSYVRGALSNLISGSFPVVGNNSLLLELQTPVSGGTYSLFFTGSQHALGVFPQTGIYSASVVVPSTNPVLQPQLQFSGSITFTPIWQSFDHTLAYLTGSQIKAFPAQRGPQSQATKNLTISAIGLRDEHVNTEQVPVRINIFDYTQPYLLNALRLPIELPGIVIRDVHYQVRDNDNGTVVVPFDTVTNSTRLSNDASTMFFTLDTSNLTPGHAYVIDIMVVTANSQQLYRGVSAVFRVVQA